MKRIAILTGASSGMGRELALQLAQWETFDELWVIARRADRLEALKEQVPFPVRPISLDLTDPQALELYRDPQTRFVAQFLGQSEALDDVRVLRGYEQYSGQALLRPENVRVSGGPDGAPEAASQPATVMRCDFRGGIYELTLALDGTPVTLTTARSGGLPPLEPGAHVGVRVRELFLCQGDRVVPVQAAG